MARSEEDFIIAADEAIFFPFFLMESLPENDGAVYLLLGNKVASMRWHPEAKEVVKDLIRGANPRAKLAYIIIKNLGGNLYEYESGVASASELKPYVMARVHLTYTRGEAMA